VEVICKFAMLFLAVVNLVREFTSIDVSAVAGGAAAIVLLSGIFLMAKGFRKVTLVFLILSGAILVFFRQPLAAWVSGVNYLTNVISILVVMQLFSIPIEAGKYSEAARYWLSKSFRSESGLFLFATVTTHVFASFLLFGTIPVMVSLLGETIKRSVSDYERFMAAAIARGYALVVFWAPGAINLLLVVQATGVSWPQLCIPGLVLSSIGIVTSWIMETRRVLSARPIPAGVCGAGIAENQRTARNKVIHVVLVVLCLMGITLLLDKLKIGGGTGRIMLAGILVVAGWTATYIRRPGIKPVALNYWHSGLLKAGDLAPLFISMGLLSTAIERSGLLLFIQPELQALANSLGVFSIVVLPLFMVGCAIVGIHPFISIVLCGHVLTQIHLSVSPVTLALCLGLGGSVSYMASPFAGIVLTLSKFINCRTVDIALRWNLAYSLVLFTEGVVFAYVWGYFFG